MTIQDQRLQSQGPASMHVGHRWAVVLAGGEGRQLQPLTTLGCGTPVPKQFCSLSGGRTLFEDALRRAEDVVGGQRVFAVVTHDHQHWWSKLLVDQSMARVVDQPCSRGTGIALLYAALRIEAVDPQGQLVILPADHHVRDESGLRRGLRHALEQVRRDGQQVVLLGIKPDQADAHLSYILPRGRGGGRLAPVSRFVEWPDIASAADLVRNGGLWNTFIMTASVPGLIGLFERLHPAVVGELRGALRRAQSEADDLSPGSSLTRCYSQLPTLDFSRDVLEGQSCLKVLRMTNCGWSDLGTPQRLAETLGHLQVDGEARRSAPFLCLAAHVESAQVRAGC